MRLLESKNLYGMDCEIFPNLFTITIVDINDRSKIFQYIIHEILDQREEILTFLKLKNLVFTSFNGLHYDNLLLAFLINYGKRGQSANQLCQSLYKLSGAIINEGTQNENVKRLKYQKLPFKSIDTMCIKPSARMGTGLKGMAIALQHELVQDLPLPYDKEITVSDIRNILDYNLNDVKITIRLFDKIKAKIELRENISELYGIDAINASESSIANLILTKTYSEKTGLAPKDFKDLRSNYDSIQLKDCIQDLIRFETPYLQKLLEELKVLTLYESNDFKYSKRVQVGSVYYDLGVGGCHSVEEPGIFTSTEEYSIYDADVNSYYPAMGELFNIYPAHLDPVFAEIRNSVTRDRLFYKTRYKETKAIEDKTRMEVLKISANAIFGRYGDKFSWMYDPKAMLSTTVNGQLLLLMLIERLNLAGILVISGNTDGLISKVHHTLLDKYFEICSAFETETKLGLEYTKYKTYTRLNVNNYFSVKEDNEVKSKGSLSDQVDIFKGTSPKIIPKAIQKYFIEGIPIEQTIRNESSVFSFIHAQKSGREFDAIYTTLENNKPVETYLQKNNRYICVTRNGGLLHKSKSSDRDSQIGILAGQLVRIINNINPDDPISSYDIDYDWYINQANSIRYQIKPKTTQLNIFSLPTEGVHSSG